MDLPLLPPTVVSEYSREGTRARFTVRSASSASYSLNRRPGVRRQKALSEEEEEEEGEGANTEEVRGRHMEEAQGQRQTDTSEEDSTDDQVKTETQSEGKGTSDPKMSVLFSSVIPGSSSDSSGSCNLVAGGRGRTERRRFDLSSRSTSLDWRGGGATGPPDQCTRTGVLAFSGNLGGIALKRDESLERGGAGDKSRAEGTESKVMSRVKAYNSTGTGNAGGEKSPVDRSPTGQAGPGLSHVTHVLERISRVQSLPSRLRPQACSGLRETASSVGSKAGQSIWERIEKLYGLTGSGKTEDSTRAKRLSAPVGDWPLSDGEGQGTVANRRRSTTDSSFVSSSSSPFSSSISQWRGASNEGQTGGTFHRHFSKGEKNGLSALQGSQTCTVQTEADSSVNPAGSILSVSTAPGGTREKAAGPRWQGPTQGRRPDERETQRGGRGVLEMGTMSLDRARSKFTVAAHIRAARAAGTVIAAHTQPNSLLEEETSTSLKDPSGRREERVGGGEEKGMANNGEGRGGVDKMSEKGKEGMGSSALKVERIREWEKEKGSDVKGIEEEKKGEENSTKTSSLAEDVFEPSKQKISLKTTERRKFPDKLVVPSAASVRNKIHQYEALAQKAQSSAVTGQFQKPRRAFSVPAQLSRAGEDGVKKSGSDRALGGLRERWDGVRKEGEAGNKRGEDMKGTGEGVKKSESGRALTVLRVNVGEEDKKVQRGLITKSASVDEVGLRLWSGKRRDSDGVEKGGEEHSSGGGGGGGGNSLDPDFGKYPRLKTTLEIPLNRGAKRQIHKNFSIDETDFSKATSPENPSKRDITTNDTPSSLYSNSNNNSNGLPRTPELPDVQNKPLLGMPSPVSDDDKTPTNTPYNSPFLSQHPLPGNTATTESRDMESTPVFTHMDPTDENTSDKGRDSLHLPPPLISSSPGSLPDLVPPDLVIIPHLKGETGDENLDAWVASLNQKIEGWNNDDDDDDEGTEKDEDSNYDSDSGGSSVTITSNMSQSDRRSFCLSLADLCNFGGVDYESENDSDEWSCGRRSASLSSDVSALSCVSVLASEELDRLLEDVRGLGDNTLQNYEDVQVVVLHKEVGVGLGFTVAGGVDQNKPITVHKVFPSGVAAQEGSIREGDQVLSINGTALCGSAHWEALRTVRRARTRGMGVVVLRRGGVSAPSKGGAGGANAQGQTQTQSTESGQRVCLRLEKRSRDLGFSLEGGVGSSLGDRPLSIQKIFQGGPVSEVLPGDEVLEIEGVSMVGMRRLEAWTLIRRLPPGPVNVVLHRPLKALEP